MCDNVITVHLLLDEICDKHAIVLFYDYDYEPLKIIVTY